MKIYSIVAASENNAIGVDNDLPWHLPADLAFFKNTTKGHFVLMGRKSFESIGRPLPGRTNIVVTRNKDFYHSGVVTVHSIADGIQYAQKADQETLFILGGSNIYSQTINLWDRLYLTRVHTKIDHATAYFPELNMNNWVLSQEERHGADEKNCYDYTFCIYNRPYF